MRVMQDKQCTLHKCDAIWALDLQDAPALEHSPARVRLGLPDVSDDALWTSGRSTCSVCESSCQRSVHLARDRGMHAPVEEPAALASGLSPRCNAACEDTKGSQWGQCRAVSMCQIAEPGDPAGQPQRRAQLLLSRQGKPQRSPAATGREERRSKNVCRRLCTPGMQPSAKEYTVRPRTGTPSSARVCLRYHAQEPRAARILLHCLHESLFTECEICFFSEKHSNMNMGAPEHFKMGG